MRIQGIVTVGLCFLSVVVTACSSNGEKTAVVEYPLICGLLGDVPTLADLPTCVVETHGPCRIDELGAGSTSFTFADDGRLLTETRDLPSPAVRMHEYEDGLLVQTTQSVTAPFNVDYTYDGEGRLDGWLRTVSDPATVVLAYNGNDRLQTLTQTGTGAAVLSYTYSSAGRLTGWTRAGDEPSESTITYDTANRVSGFTQESEKTTYVITYEYSPTGALAGWEREGTAPSKVTIAYGADGRVSMVKQTGTDASTYIFGYDCE